MSRSYRKTKIFGVSGDSEKHDKRIANRKFRKLSKNKIAAGKEDLPTHLKDVSNVWNFSKDGKLYWDDATKKDMSK